MNEVRTRTELYDPVKYQTKLILQSTGLVNLDSSDHVYIFDV